MKLFKFQGWHLLWLGLLLLAVSLMINKDPNLVVGQLWGIGSSTWLWLAILAPVAHQFYVAFCWRYELYFQGITQQFGDRGFRIYKVGFAILILSRVLLVVLLAVSNTGTLDISFPVAALLSGLMILPVIYLFYSVFTYFGIDKAFGIDHFKPELVKNEPMVKQGIFKYTSNGMYVFGFLLLWIPGLLALSKAAILVALFNHIYIWVHYYCTELPDMKAIYRS